ncbi:MAG: hypothetical protein KKF30_04730 [Proteobacteria bacterium]|nr:hypothetical protein [Pseudomonadota bacterium]MBU4470463.1 hypothetical protein [Pseudomonadota bacterium]MCG2753516.1 hypothetical protein [Desulfobacteraceae bacterium]
MDIMPLRAMEILRVGTVLLASAIIGNWFMAEQKKNKVRGLPWYRVYLTVPGMIIVAAVLILPLMLVFFKQ